MSFDELYDEMLHEEFRSTTDGGSARHGIRQTLSNPSRSRTVALVASGGAACAVVGALLGGLGGEFGIVPAAAHSLSNSSQFAPLTSLANASFNVPRVALAATPAVKAKSATSIVTSSTNGVTTLPTTLGGVVKGITAVAPSEPVLDTSSSPGGITDVVTTSSVDPAGSTGTTTAATGGLGAVTGVLTGGLDAVLSDLTKSLSGIATLPTDPTAGLTGVITPLADVLSDLSSTLTNLISVLPATSTLGVPGLPVALAGAPAVHNSTPAVTNGSTHVSNTAAPKTGSTPTFNQLLNAVTGPAGGILAPGSNPSAGTGLPSLPTSISLPVLGSIPLPSLPVSSAPTLTLPTVNLPVLPVAAGSTPTCVSTPSLPLPLPTGISGSINLGAVSVGVSLGGNTSAEVCAQP